MILQTTVDELSKKLTECLQENGELEIAYARVVLALEEMTQDRNRLKRLLGESDDDGSGGAAGLGRAIAPAKPIPVAPVPMIVPDVARSIIRAVTAMRARLREAQTIVLTMSAPGQEPPPVPDDLHECAQLGLLDRVPQHRINSDSLVLLDDDGLTVIEVAAKYGHLGQIPAELRPKENSPADVVDSAITRLERIADGDRDVGIGRCAGRRTNAQ